MSYADRNKQLVQVTDLENNDDEKNKDPVIMRLDDMKEHIESMHLTMDKMNTMITKIMKKVDKQVPDDKDDEN